jgi:chromosome segregation ATPase
MQQMKSALQGIGHIQAEIEARMQDAHQSIVQQQAQLNSAEEKLTQLASLRSELESQMHEANGELKNQKQMLSGLESHLTKIDEIHRWIEANKSEYDKQMKALADYIMSAEVDYNAIKESIETGFVRRYLKDLRSISQSYEFEISQAAQTEEDIDSRIAQAKYQMKEMIAKARQIADLQELALSQSDEDTKDRALEALSRAGKAEGVLKGKERQRIKLIIRQAIDGQPPYAQEIAAPKALAKRGKARSRKGRK